jgi:hypothetical protein
VSSSLAGRSAVPFPRMGLQFEIAKAIVKNLLTAHVVL